jgi:DNA-binding CsgD family transcriptional regulator
VHPPWVDAGALRHSPEGEVAGSSVGRVAPTFRCGLGMSDRRTHERALALGHLGVDADVGRLGGRSWREQRWGRAVVSGDSRRGAAVVMGETPALYGRDAEVAATRRFLARVGRGPAGLVLWGSAGIGKSFVWSDAVVVARSTGTRVICSRPAEADAGVAFAGLRDLVGEAAPDVLAVLSVPQRRALAVALLLEEPGTEPVDPGVVSASVVSVLRALCSGGSLVVAIDDVQWLDEPTRSALAFALRRMSEGERVGLLATSRPEGDEFGALAGGLVRDSVERVELGPLSVAALHRIVVDRTGVTLRRPTLMRLHEMSGGNPLYALEIVRGLGDDAELAVPRDLSALLRARLAVLAPRAREVALTAAALSRPTRTLLDQIEGDVDDELDEAATAEIIELDGDVVRFAHPLLASVHYTAASPARRRAVHARIAGSGLDVEERARHLALATQEPNDDVAAVLDAAVVVARQRAALGTAAELARAAVAMTPPGAPARHRRVLGAVDLAYSSGDSQGAARLARVALAADMAPGERAELLLALARVEHERDAHAAGEALREARDLAGADLRLTVELLVELAATEYELFRFREALQLAERAESIAEQVGDSALLALAVGAVAFFEGNLTGVIPAARFERAVALEERAGTHIGENSAAFDYGQELLDAWELEPARAIFQRLVTAARADGHGALAEYLDNLAFVELCIGNLASASTLAHEAVELASQFGRTAVEVYALFRLGWIEGLRGNVDAARVACERSLRLAASSNGFTRGARLSLGYLESSLENYDSAWAYLDPSAPATGELPPERPVVHVPEMVEVLAALGKTDEARAKLAPFASRAAELGRRWALARAAHCRGLILAAAGDLATAEGALDDAVTQGAVNGWPVPLGRALLALGSVQRRRRRKADARHNLERAVALFDDAGAVIWRDRAGRELGRIGGRSAPAGDDLSTTERDIFRLVAEGRANKQVANDLHLSVKTVEWNLTKIYRKVGVRSRTELIALRASKPGEPSG